MCVVSMVYDHYQPQIDRWYVPPPVVPFVPGPGPRLSPDDVGAIRRLLEEFREAKGAAKRVDALTGQPDCVDPGKATLDQRVLALEESLVRIERLLLAPAPAPDGGSR